MLAKLLSDILVMQHLEILPEGNVLPTSYNDALKQIQPYLIKPITYHCCQNDCIVYRNQYSRVQSYPSCGESRYSHSRVPAKTLTYLPLGPRLKHMFGTENLAKIVQEHGFEDTSKMYDLHHSPGRKETYCDVFQNDKRGISLGFCTDGVNPFKHNNVAYSM